ncbi:Protein RRNAD1 [Toxocara canis]|uniref:Protein RRNAD1 n=1 Tax=Toxocara canis TaxID=6265 RepID=A0A0B2UYF6_TOXCA|nr:Protein RRNAD1 [Toxocara canis]
MCCCSDSGMGMAMCYSVEYGEVEVQRASIEQSHFFIEKLHDLVCFIQSYSYLHENVNIRSEHSETQQMEQKNEFEEKLRGGSQVWKVLPVGQFFGKNQWLRYLSTLSSAQLNVFPFEEPSSECPESLRKFLTESRHCSLLSNNAERYRFEEVCSWKEEKREKMNIPISAKKQHELQRLAQLITSHCYLHRVNRIVDVGCGLGHLLNLLSSKFDVVGIECDEVLCSAGSKKYASVKYENLTLNAVSVDQRRVLNIFCGAKGERSAIVSLHGCGDLQPDLLRWFTQLPKDRVPLLFTVACCYHKMSCAGKPVIELAMSNSLRSLCRNHWILKKSSMRLACQEQLSRWPCSKEKRELHAISFLQRALLECVYERIGIGKSKRCPRRLNRSFRELKNVGVEIAERLGLDDRKRAQIIDEYERVYSDYQHLFNIVEPFTLLQALMQMPLESLILVDRYLYLVESGCLTCVVPVFDSKVSPRNFCLVSFQDC